MKTKKLIKFIEFGTYPDRVLFSVGMKYSEILHWLKKRKFNQYVACIDNDHAKSMIENSFGLTLKQTVTNTKNGQEFTGFFIFLQEFNPDNYSISCLSHEIVHLTQFYFENRIDRSKEWECEAYFHGHILKQALDILSKK